MNLKQLSQKLMIIPLAFTFLQGCGPSNSQQLSDLADKKKIVKDSVRYYRGYESFFNGKAIEISRATHDTLKYRPMMDSQARYSNLAANSEAILKSINASIDSLNKLK